MPKKRDPPVQPFDRTLTCNRRTDRHKTIAYTSLVQRRAGKKSL